MAHMPLDRHELIDPLDRALVVISHPDDAEFGAAATIAALTAARRAGRLRGDHRRREGTEDPAVAPEQLAATRIAEQRAAADVLGVREIVHLGYPDGYLTPEPRPPARHHATDPRFRPDLVITQNPQRRLDHNPFIGHPDHLATGEATLAIGLPRRARPAELPRARARRGLEPWKVRQVLLTGVEQPNLWIDVAATFETGLARAPVPRQPDRRPTTSRSGCASARETTGEPQGIGLAQASSRSSWNDARAAVVGSGGRSRT